MKRLPSKRALSVSEQRDAYGKALDQAAALLEEAELLAAHGKYAGAFHRAVIALEELGKVRLIALKGMLAAGRKQVSWEEFWKAYYSHEAKLHEAILWAEAVPVLGMPETVEELEAAIRKVQSDAEQLDVAKQQASYSGPMGDEFSRPCDATFDTDAKRVLALAQGLLAWARSHPLSNVHDNAAFKSALEDGFRHASALGYDRPESREKFLEAVARSNRPLFLIGEDAPSEEALMKRVAERYEVLPPLLSVTLSQLRGDQKFKRFYRRLRLRHGYPDWMILGTIYNIVLHARVDVSAYVPDRIAELWMWGEDATIHAPLDIKLFTEMPTFDRTLDRWLAAFLAGIGVAPPPGTSDEKEIRRLAARHFDIFSRDVEHAPVFGFEAPT